MVLPKAVSEHTNRVFSHITLYSEYWDVLPPCKNMSYKHYNAEINKYDKNKNKQVEKYTFKPFRKYKSG